MPPTAEDFTQRLLDAVLGAQFVQAAYLGDRLGWYRALADGPLTPDELAVRTATSARYAREWLEHQAVCGVLTVDGGRFTLPAGAAEVLTDELSPQYVLPLARMMAGLGRRMDDLVEAYRSGGGVSWEQFGADAREAQAAANRPLFLGPVAREYLPSVPEIAGVLTGGGRVADIGCGFGWSAIGLALAHPAVTVDGVDVDVPSVETARRNAADAGVGDRVGFRVGGADSLPAQAYDLVAAYECIHDLPDPVGVLAAMRGLVRPGGTVLVMDERVAETFTAPGDEVEQLMYGYSLMCCLPDGMAHEGSAGTGTVMRPDTLRRYAGAAGFADVEILPIDDAFFRFYRLT